MPCNSDYMRPSDGELALMQTAKLLVYLYGKLNRKPAGWVLKEADNDYAQDERLVPLLCGLVASLKPEQINEFVYDARSAGARQLADWWEIHLAADAERKREEEKSRERHKLQKAGISKLTAAEREALGI